MNHPVKELRKEIAKARSDSARVQFGEVTAVAPVEVTFDGGESSIPCYVSPGVQTVIGERVAVLKHGNAPGIVLGISTDEPAGITGDWIAAGTITAANIKAGSITAIAIEAHSITAELIKAGTITATEIKAGTITSNEIKALSIEAAVIAASAITAGKIAAEAVEAANIKAGAITAGKIAAEAVEAGSIKAGAITAGKIAAEAVEASKIKAETITATQIAANAITSAKIAANTIEAGDIKAATITTAEIAANTIKAGNIAAEAITTTELKANTIEAGDIKANTITSAQIASGTITTGEIASGTITGGNIASGTITAGKISISELSALSANLGTITAGTVTGATIRTAASGKRAVFDSSGIRLYDGTEAVVFNADTSTGSLKLKGTIETGSSVPASTVTGLLTNAQLEAIEAAKITGEIINSQLAENSVKAKQIAAEAIEASEIKTGAVTEVKIGSEAISAPKIAANAVEASKIKAEAVEAAAIKAGAITAGKIAAEAVEASKIKSEAVEATHIKALTITAAKIAAETITSGKIAAGEIKAVNIAAEAIEASKIKSEAVESSHIKANTIVAGDIAALTITAAQIAGETITGAKLVANTITASQLSATAIDTMTLTGTTIKTSAVNPRVELTSAGLSAYSSSGEKAFNFDTSTGTLSIGKTWTGWETRTNLLINPGFEVNVTDGWSSTAGGFWINSGSTVSRVTTEHQDGLAAMKIVTPGGTAYQGASTYPSLIAVTSGQKYTISAWVKGAVGGEEVVLGFGDATVGFVSKEVTLTTSWQRISATLTAAATNNTYGAVRVPGTTAVTCYVDNVMVENAAEMGDYFPTEAQLLTGQAGWNGESNKSTSKFNLLGLIASSIKGTQITNGTITAEKLSVTTLAAITANLGTVTAGSIESVVINLPQAETPTAANALNWKQSGTVTQFISAYGKVGAEGYRDIIMGTGSSYNIASGESAIRLQSSDAGSAAFDLCTLQTGTKFTTIMNGESGSNFIQNPSVSKRILNAAGSVSTEWTEESTISQVKTVTHELGATPTSIQLTCGSSEGATVPVTARYIEGSKTSTQFKFRLQAPVKVTKGTKVLVDWVAIV